MQGRKGGGTPSQCALAVTSEEKSAWLPRVKFAEELYDGCWRARFCCGASIYTMGYIATNWLVEEARYSRMQCVLHDRQYVRGITPVHIRHVERCAYSRGQVVRPSYL